MSSEDIAIRVDSVSMCFELYDAPRDQLKQFVLPRLQRMVGLPARQYFREFWALRDISFEVKKGESVGIVGRNGSGKSTLLQIITGTLTPTKGSVETRGRIAALLELGSGFNPEFTGRENVYLNGALLGLSQTQIDDKFDSIAAFADIGMHLDQPVKTYSSGMLVRLAFAVQVQVEPDILIVDEALAVGDALFQKRCYQRIEELIARGTTLLFVSHDQESVRTLTNNSLLLNHGKKAAVGKSSDVVREYRKILHSEEHEYLNRVRATTPFKIEKEGEQAIARQIYSKSEKSELLSFGNMDGSIHAVKVLNLTTNDATSFQSGDLIEIEVSFSLIKPLSGLNIGIMIRNKEGVKIHAWGTLNQDISILNKFRDGEVFWLKEIPANVLIKVYFQFECVLGENLYEVQAAILQFDSPNYELSPSRIVCWQDEAAFIRSTLNRQENFFGGVCDLHMIANQRSLL